MSDPCRKMAVILLALAVFANATPACQCEPPPAPLIAMAETDAVFVATIIGVTEPPAAQIISSADIMTYRARVEHGWKGPQDTVNVYTNREGASCGFPFKVSSQYLIYGKWQDGSPASQWQHPPRPILPPGVRVNACSRTSEIGNALYDLFMIGQPKSSVAGSVLPDASIAAMNGYLESEENPFFWGAATALSQIDSERRALVEAMRRVIRSSDRQQQMRAIGMLHRLGPAATDALPDLLKVLDDMRPTDTYDPFYTHVESAVRSIQSPVGK